MASHSSVLRVDSRPLIAYTGMRESSPGNRLVIFSERCDEFEVGDLFHRHLSYNLLLGFPHNKIDGGHPIKVLSLKGAKVVNFRHFY